MPAIMGILVGIPHVSRASTVITMSIQTMADHAGQVIVGTVVDSRSYYIDNPRGIETEITLERVEYLKGRLPNSRERFTLRLPGGTIGDRQMRVCCAPLPGIGEKWLLLLLPEYRTYPIVGLYQGAFRIVADAKGVERVYRAANEPVTGFDNTGMIQIDGHKLRNGHDRLLASQRVRVTELAPAKPTMRAMSLTDFRAALEPVLATSKRHLLIAPAGRRIPTHYRAVPLRSANGTATNPRSDSAQRLYRSISLQNDRGKPQSTPWEKR